MKPWDIIGWCIIVACAGTVAVVLLSWGIGAAMPLVWHYRTRATPPAAGQRWVQDGSTLHIKRVTEAGVVLIETRGRMSTTSWVDTPADWLERVRNRRLYLAS